MWSPVCDVYSPEAKKEKYDIRKHTCKEHICEENKNFGTASEDKVYKYDGEWYLSLDCGCCNAEIKHCPFCGKKLI